MQCIKRQQTENMKTNTKAVREVMRQHILENVTDDNGDTFPDFNTPKGIRAVAAYLEQQAEIPHPDGASIRVGHLKIHATLRGLLEAAGMLRKKSAAAGKPKARMWVMPSPSPHRYGREPEIEIGKFDAVRHCGTPEAALETIERQLATQGEYMEAADVKRCQCAAERIRCHLWSIEEAARADKEAKELLDAVDRAKFPGLAEIVPVGTRIVCGRLLGTVTGSLLLKNGGARHAADFTLKIRYDGKTERVARRTYKALTPHQIKTLP